MKFKKDHLGYIELEKLSLKNKEEINQLHSFTFLYLGKRYFFKEAKNVSQSYNELIGYELAKDFGLEAVPYDLASYNGHVGFLSQDYMKDGYVCLEDLLVKYYGTDEGKNNLDDASIMIRDTFPYESSEKIISDLVRLLMFDIIIGNYDRHDQNIIIDTNNGRLAPVSDNELLLSDDAMYGQFYAFRITPDDKITLDNFLNYLSSDELFEFARKALIISENNIESVMSRVEKRIGHPMIEPLKLEIIKKFTDYFHFLLRKIDKEVEYRYTLKKSR